MSQKDTKEELQAPTKPTQTRASYLFVGLLSVAAIILSSYLWWQLDALRRDMRFKQQDVQDTIEATSKSSQTSQSQLQSLQDKISALTSQQQALQESISKTNNTPSPMAYLQPLLIMDHLLLMADVEINSLGNINTGISLLDIVHSQLNVLPAETSKQLQQEFNAISQQLAKLPPDSTTLINHLRELQKNIEALPQQITAPQYELNTQQASTQQTTSGTPFWREIMLSSVEFLSQFFRIQHYEAKFQAPLPISEQQSQHYLLTLLVEQAIVAALQHDATTYHQALQSTDDLLASFHPTEESVKIREEIAKLQSTSPKLPEININSMRQLLNTAASSSPTKGVTP